MTSQSYQKSSAKTTSLSDFNDKRRWVAWRTEDRDGEPTKVPYNPVTGGKAMANQPSTWATRRAATRRAKMMKADGVGIMLGDLGDGSHLCGVDLDSCLDGEILAGWAEEVIYRFKTYTDISPSLKGVKLFFLVSDRDRQAISDKQRIAFTKGKHLELALDLGNRYYAVTGKPLDDLVGPQPLRVVGLDDLQWLVNVAGPAFAGQKSKARDESGSGHAYRFCLGLATYGLSAEEIEADLRADDGPAGEWAARVDDRQIQRCIARAVAAAKEYDRRADRFNDLMGEAIDGFDLDEDGVIRAFTERYKDELLFDHHASKWFRFDGYWRREETKLALHYARDESVKLADAKVKALKRVSTWEAVERGARSVREFSVTSGVWNRHKMLLGTPDGTVDLCTGKLRPGHPADRISRVTAVAPIPDFKPERDCPRWLAFLDEALAGDKAAIRFLQQWGGYSLTGETNEQVLVFVYGPGGSGKGTAINTIGDILGDYAVNVGMETLTASKHDRHTTELARLRGARMARASETEKGRALAENRIKNLTGQDTITARFMRQDDFEFLPEFKLTIFGNNRPSLKDVDTAMRRRVIVLPFDHPPVRKDPELAEKLKSEWRGILSWLIVGCLDWQANGLVRPSVVEDATDAYFAEQDIFGQWLDERCETGPQFADTTDALWQSWSRYAYGLGEEPGSKNRTFPETLSQRGFRLVRDSAGIRGRGFKGLRVRDDVRDNDELF